MKMIVKEREVPLTILKLEALLRRISAQHPKRPEIEKDLARRRAGLRGEESLDYYLKELDDQSYSIFHDIRLSLNDYYFQIDTLIISNFFALIIEVKNISGTLHLDHSFNQLIRTKADGTEEGFPDPFSQVDQQKRHLQKWLQQQKLPIIPIETLVVIANPSTIIKTTTNHTPQNQKLCHSVKLIEKINWYTNRYKNEVISQKSRRKLHKTLLKMHTSLNIDILRRFEVSRAEIINGINCPKCFYNPIQHIHGKWHCPKCQYSSKNAHIQALEEYGLLIQFSITNQQFRHFTHLSSRFVANRILTSMSLKQTGTNKGRVYYLNQP